MNLKHVREAAELADQYEKLQAFRKRVATKRSSKRVSEDDKWCLVLNPDWDQGEPDYEIEVDLGLALQVIDGELDKLRKRLQALGVTIE